MSSKSKSSRGAYKCLTGSIICLLLTQLMLAGSPICPSAHAQGRTSQIQNYQLPNLLKNRAQTTSTQHAPDEFKPDKLTAIIELPNVPNYTGHAVFVSGLKYPRDRSGVRIGMTIGVREDENEVLEWYKSALKTYGWMVISANPNDKYVSAAKDKNTFTVRISPSKQPGFRTLVVLSYKFGI
ncbi:MAG: hypothetical protein IT342_09930 [Candidatus Melainabacteria bacterium]|nr:hypothetical protein [Candidatus Melainabacteria bacterium]